MTEQKFQIGKNGITSGVLDSLTLMFKKNKRIRISALKSSGRDRNTIETLAKELALKLSHLSENNFSYKIIGFKIIMTRHSK